MSLAERLRHFFWRWNRVGMAVLLALPLLLTALFGFLWLFERGWLLFFVLGSVAFYMGMRGLRLLARWRRPAEPLPRQLEGPTDDPAWSAEERAAYKRARGFIASRLPQPLPWEALPAEALAVVEQVAADLSGGRRSALDFTLPEALLLIDRVALRYREFLRRHVPFSDQLSVRALYWLWRRQDQALMAWETGFMAWRGVRLVLNPAVGLLREVERVMLSGLQDRLTDEFQRDAQAILLEEAAQAAVDLFSGRLRFSEAELNRVEPRADRRDHARLAPDDAPLRVLVVGQVSAGKSTLINALLADPRAETDMAPTTENLTVHPAELDGVPCKLVDTRGLDSSAPAQKALLAELMEADLVLWVLRANRPARGPDKDLLERLKRAFDAAPARRRPPIVFVATAADALFPEWPFAEHDLPDAARHRLGQAMAALASEVGTAAHGHKVVIPLRAEPPEWNIEGLFDVLDEHWTEARMTQRNRRRIAAQAPARAVGENFQRAGRGIGAAVRLIGHRLRQRLPANRKDAGED